MKSNICEIKIGGIGLKNILVEVEKVASYNCLEKKQALRLRLLAEELKISSQDAKKMIQENEEKHQKRHEKDTKEIIQLREEKVKLNEAIKTKTIIMNNSDRQRYLLMIKEHRIPNSIHQIEKRYINGNKKEFEHVIINLSCVKEETIKIPTVVRLESTDDLSLYYVKITRKELIEKKKIILDLKTVVMLRCL